MYEYLSDRLRVESSLEGRKYYGNQLTEIMKDLGKDYDLKKGFTTAIKQYIQGRCVEKEKEYEEAQHVYNAEMLKRYKEEEKQRKIAERKAEVAEFSMRNFETGEMARTIPEEVINEYRKLRNTQNKYRLVAERLGIPFDILLDEQPINQTISDLQENIRKIEEQLSKLEIKEDSSKEEVSENTNELIEVENTVNEAVNRVRTNLHNSANNYNGQALNEIRKGVDGKVFYLINSAKVAKLQQKRVEVTDRKISLIGRLRGENKLRELELQNIDQEIENIRLLVPPKRTEYSIKDSLADMECYVCTEMDGRYTPEMEQFFMDTLNTIIDDSKREESEAKIREEINNRANLKIQNLPIPQQDWKSQSLAQRKQMEEEKSRQLNLERGKIAEDRYAMSQFGYTNTNAVPEFTMAIKQIETITRPKLNNNRSKNSQSYDYHE